MKKEEAQIVADMPNPLAEKYDPMIRRAPDWLEIPKSVFSEADEIVNGDREQTYGHPAKNLHATALMWKAHIEAKYDIVVPLDAFDVAWMMANLKQCRQMHMHKRDNLVDAIGYIGLEQKIREYNDRLGSEKCNASQPASSKPASPQVSGSGLVSSSK